MEAFTEKLKRIERYNEINNIYKDISENRISYPESDMLSIYKRNDDTYFSHIVIKSPQSLLITVI